MMTPQQIEAERNWYTWKCKTDYPLTYKTMHSIQSYSSIQSEMAAAEAAYYFENDRLPAWGSVIQSAETINGNTLFIHNDLTKDNQ